MAPGDTVVLLSDPWANGLGTIIGLNEIAWIEVQWANSELGAYPAQHLELADTWKRQQAEEAFN